MAAGELDIAPGTVSQTLALARRALAHHYQADGSEGHSEDGYRDQGNLDAEVLLRDTLGCSRAWLIAHGNEPLPASAHSAFVARLRQRAAGQPVAYITGQREFWSLPLSVSPDVLIPRADTEILVECVLDILPVQVFTDVCELGTGSGAIALAIATERPLSRITATDSSLPALRVAQRNARRLNDKLLANEPQFVAANWLAAFAADCFDVVVSNPPYVRHDDPHLSRGDLRFEPTQALRANDSGLAELGIIINQAPHCLRNGGAIALEHGHDQGKPVRELLASRGFEQIRTHSDLAGHERVSQAQFVHR